MGLATHTRRVCGTRNQGGMGPYLRVMQRRTMHVGISCMPLRCHGLELRSRSGWTRTAHPDTPTWPLPRSPYLLRANSASNVGKDSNFHFTRHPVAAIGSKVQQYLLVEEQAWCRHIRRGQCGEGAAGRHGQLMPSVPHAAPSKTLRQPAPRAFRSAWGLGLANFQVGPEPLRRFRSTAAALERVPTRTRHLR